MNKRTYLLTLVLVVMQVGCSLGQPTRPASFYVLGAEPGAPVKGRQNPAEPLTLGLGPLSLPDILDRPQIVTRPAAYRINLAEYDRWGGDLKRNLDQVMTLNLMSRLNTDSVLTYPWPNREEPDFQLTIRFFRFDGELDNVAGIEGVWRLLDGKLGCEIAVDGFKYEARPAGPEHSDLVGAMSRSIARLSQEIAERIVENTTGCETNK